MEGKPNPRRALAVKLQNIARFLAGSARCVDELLKSPEDLQWADVFAGGEQIDDDEPPDETLCRNVSNICLGLEEAGKLARDIQERDAAIAIEITLAELRTHVLFGVTNLSGLVGVAERCTPKLLGAYARLVVPLDDDRHRLNEIAAIIEKSDNQSLFRCITKSEIEQIRKLANPSDLDRLPLLPR